MKHKKIVMGKVQVLEIKGPSEDVIKELFNIEIGVHIDPWTYDSLKACFTNDSAKIFGLFYNEQIIGYSVISLVYEDAELWNIALSSDYQGLGLGRFLLKESINKAKLYNAKNMYLEVRVSNIRALNLYYSIGFVDNGLRKNYYPKKGDREAEDALTMWCDLTLVE